MPRSVRLTQYLFFPEHSETPRHSQKDSSDQLLVQLASYAPSQDSSSYRKALKVTLLYPRYRNSLIARPVRPCSPLESLMLGWKRPRSYRPNTGKKPSEKVTPTTAN